MAFAIYIPGDGRTSEQKLHDVGLPHLASNVNAIPTPAGPDDGKGVVFSWFAPRDRRGPMPYIPERQEWTPSNDPGRFWLGFWRGEQPTPEDLASGSHPGIETVLGDGQTWIIPSAGAFVADIEIGADFVPEYRTQADYVPLALASQKWANWLDQYGNPDAPMQISSTVVDYLESMLKLNYRVFPELTSRLGLFNASTIPRALLAATHGVHATSIEEIH